MDKEGFRNLLWIAFLLASVFSLVPLIDNYNYTFFLKRGIFEKDILYRVLGDTRRIFSDYSFARADEYFHGGIKPKDKNECEQIDHMLEHQADEHADVHHHHEHRHRKDRKAVTTSKWNILPYIGEVIDIHKHIHLHGEEEKELLPWFYYAVRLSPENINAYVIGGYWIGRRLDRPDEAIRFLKEGVVHNPDAWEIYAQLGQIYFLDKKDYAQALASFQKAYQLLTDDNSDKFDKRSVYSFLADCYEKLGENEKALELHKKVLTLFPHIKSIPK